MKVALDPEEVIAEWVADRLPDPAMFMPPYRTIAVFRDDVIAAAAVFHDYRGPNPEISFAAETPRWATRDAISLILGLPFLNPATQRITAICHKKNKRVRKLNEGIGFKLEGVLRSAYPTGDGCLYGLTRRDFEEGRYGKRQQLAAAG